MFRSYLKVALRNLWRSKGFSSINIAGLSIGMASAMLISVWIYNELTFDRFHKKDTYLYQVWNRGTFEGKVDVWDAVPKILGPTLKLEFPQIANATRVVARSFVT